MIRMSGNGLRVGAGLLSLLASACYSFAGGGLPGHIRTVAILPFDNRTAEPTLTQEVAEALTEAMESRLGLRLASEETADAVVRGTISQYTPDAPLSFQAARSGGNVAVTRRMVVLSLQVEIYDQREGRVLWERSGLRVDGEYTPPNEQQGREVALDKLVNDIVDGAQSQW